MNKSIINIIEEIEKRFEEELKERKFIDDSDNSDRYLDNLVYDIYKGNRELADEDFIHDMTGKLIDLVQDRLKEKITYININDLGYVYVYDVEGLYMCIESHLTHTKGDTYTEEEKNELVNKFTDVVRGL